MHSGVDFLKNCAQICIATTNAELFDCFFSDYEAKHQKHFLAHIFFTRKISRKVGRQVQ